MYTKSEIVPFCPYHFVHTILSNTILSIYHFVRTILSIPFCPYTISSNTILSVYHFVHTILSVPFCPLPFCPVTIHSVVLIIRFSNLIASCHFQYSCIVEVKLLKMKYGILDARI